MIIETYELFWIQVNETIIKIGSYFIWVWIAIELTNKKIFGFSISKNEIYLLRCVFYSFSGTYGEFSISTNDWVSYLPSILKLEYHIKSSYEKSIVERSMPYIRDRTMLRQLFFLTEKKKM